MRKILEGIRALDLTRVLAGPWATQNLADLGAEVIKIERPGQGDDTRKWGPPFVRDREGRDTADAAYFMAANRGKKSVTLDIASAEGQEIARRLAAASDVVVENFKVGDLARYGLDYARLRQGHEGLVYCSITGFGQDGPYRDRPGYDFMIQGLGGLMSVTGERDDLAGGGPQKVGVAVADLFTGMYATSAIVAALFHRERTGEGQHIDLALLDAQVAMLANLSAAYLASGRVPGRMGNAHQAIVPYQVFRAADGFLIVAVGNDGQFARFCEVAGLAALATDPRFATNPARVAHRDELVAVIAGRLATRPAAEWLAALEAAQVPCGPINDLAQVFADPQVLHRGMVATLPHAAAGEVRVVANPVRFSATPARSERAPPRLGEHTDEVLGGLLGLPAAALEDLRARRVI
ncbi:MAG TPA: CaiB/BaiF CoA-transferase family protein [Usitatibacteraceae bacterium]|nr:CaiB/BaiF CoA-transferase family protein [Usitatibacteraceae bacterium]HRA22464.1 CaiB/BaiF CoA-transferase family protein [Usitatibacteraceae bacterium]